MLVAYLRGISNEANCSIPEIKDTRTSKKEYKTLFRQIRGITTSDDSRGIEKCRINMEGIIRREEASRSPARWTSDALAGPDNKKGRDSAGNPAKLLPFFRGIAIRGGRA